MRVADCSAVSMSVLCESDLPRDLPRGPISATSLTSPRSRRLRCTWRRRQRWRESSPSALLVACRSSPISTTSRIERSSIAQLSHRSRSRPKLSIRAIAAAPIQRKAVRSRTRVGAPIAMLPRAFERALQSRARAHPGHAQQVVGRLPKTMRLLERPRGEERGGESKAIPLGYFNYLAPRAKLVSDARSKTPPEPTGC